MSIIIVRSEKIKEIFYMYITAQIIGIIALTLAMISFQQKTHKYILAFQLASNVMFVFHFALLGAYTGAVLNLVAALRAVVFVNKGRAWADKKLWLYLFCILSVAVGIFTWENWASVLPIAGMVCGTVAFWIKTPKFVRLTVFPSSPLWLVYNLMNRSYAGVAAEIMNMASLIIAIIRFDIKRKSE